jgi:CO/xanthine dehydrogenase FAD-binding subunit
MGIYLRPAELDDALKALAAHRLTVLAGGTDFFPARVGKPLDDDVLDITALAALRGIADTGGAHRIGALTTWTDLTRADLPPHFDGLKQAAREVGGVQVQNAGTVAGNVCNASPAADGMPNLVALDAEVELASNAGRRTMPLASFVTGNRKTQRRPDEIVTALLIPKPAQPARSTFLKLGARKYLVISIVMVGAVVETDGERIARARIAVGSCSAVAQRLPALEAALQGQMLSGGAKAVTAAHLAPLAPIDDVRGTADYRRDAALTLVRRALMELA